MKNGEFGDRRAYLSLRRPSRMGKSCGGDSVPELAERFARAGGEVTPRPGDVFHADETHDAHGEATQRRHHAGSVLGANLGEIFVVGGIADMMVAVFDLPMAPGDAEQVFRRRPILGQAGEPEGVIIADGAVLPVNGDSLNQEGLTEMGEVDAGRLSGDGDFTVFKTAMTDINRFGAEGGNPPRGGRSDCCGVFAGCL